MAGLARWDHPGLEYSQLEPWKGILPSEAQIHQMVRLRERNQVSIDQEIAAFAYTPLTLAAGMGFRGLALSIIEGKGSVDCKDRKGNTALILATQERQTQVLEALLQARASVNEANTNGDTALSVCACNGEFDIARLLIASYAQVQNANRSGQTPLMYASLYGHSHIIKTLLQARADCNKSDVRGMSALMYASHRGEVKSVQLLLRNGADVYQKEVLMGRNALDIARKRGYKKIIEVLQAWQELPNVVLALLKIRFPEDMAELVFAYWNKDLLYVRRQNLGRRRKISSNPGRSKKSGCVIS
mmetsp:Transcript_8876/g.12448  ORF Transcript_8876/g.12448 Transcript_8876/m.12448 type:complete len:301 (+) Transcript_8876:25-927(+)